MKLVITGAHGFIGKNLRVHLQEAGNTDIRCIGRDSSADDLQTALADADFVFHLAGVNRPQDPAEFNSGNVGLTEQLVAILRASGRAVPVAYTSSTQATQNNAYGESKCAAEQVLLDYGKTCSAPVYLFRLPNIFGKWSQPFYNSAVATFCHQIARGEAITINNPDSPLRLMYIDDVCQAFIRLLSEDKPRAGMQNVAPVYDTTVGALATQLQAFHASRDSLISEAVGGGLIRALYSTYISFLPNEAFAYSVPSYGDQRGVFVEILKTKDSGQFSFFTAHPGITRGGHYHHSKTEKFMVIKGEARFGFRHILSDEKFELLTSGSEPKIVETIPGWAHDITNIGTDEMMVMLWANEVFDRAHPDTITHEV